jgi:integrase
MRWDSISLDTAVWTIPGTSSKNKKPMNIALSPPALEILTRRKETALGPWVLPGQGPTGHFTCPRDALRTVLQLSGLKDVRVHDLRRTLGSWMAIDTPLQVIGKQLGHSSLKSTAIYARLATKTLKDAVSKATDAMQAASGKKPKIK